MLALPAVLLLVGVAVEMVLPQMKREEPTPLFVYRTASEAINIAAGNFGAVPIAIVDGTRVKRSTSCKYFAQLSQQIAGAVCVELPSGELAWAVASELR